MRYTTPNKHQLIDLTVHFNIQFRKHIYKKNVDFRQSIVFFLSEYVR